MGTIYFSLDDTLESFTPDNYLTRARMDPSHPSNLASKNGGLTVRVFQNGFQKPFDNNSSLLTRVGSG